MRQILQRLERFTSETWAIVGLLTFGLSYRLVTLPVPRDGGDAMRKWMWGRLILEGWPPSTAIWGQRWDHHAARVAINVPVLITQALFGTHPNLYYVTPLLAHLLGLVLVYKIGKRVCGATAAFWTGILWTFLSSVEWTSQLMPEPFSAMYLLACIYCLIRLEKPANTAQGWRWLILGALAMLLAYLCKLPNLFFMPGLLLAIWLVTRRWQWVIGFGAIVALGMAIETVLYRELLDYPLGRISVIKGGHLKSDKMKEPIESLWGFFSRYKPVFSDEMGPILALFLPASAIGLVFFRSLSGPLKIVLLSCLSFLFFQTFAVQSIDPLLPVQPARSRYLAVIMSPMMLVLAAGVSRSVSITLPQWLATRPRYGALFVLMGLSTYGWLKHWPGLDQHPLVRLAQYKRLAEHAERKGLPIIAQDFRSSTMKTYQALFWDGMSLPHNKKRKRMPRWYIYGKNRTKLWFMAEELKNKRLSSSKRRQVLAKWKGREVLKMTHKRTAVLTLKKTRLQPTTRY